jgi:hypothetical protein
MLRSSSCLEVQPAVCMGFVGSGNFGDTTGYGWLMSCSHRTGRGLTPVYAYLPLQQHDFDTVRPFDGLGL